MKKILITGGAGFIGSHLCEKLLSLGHSVTALDNLFSGSKKNIEHLLLNSNFKFVSGDVTDKINISSGLDEIYNLACPASPVWYQKDPVKTVKTNVLGMANVLELAKVKGARVLQASTSEVYGDPNIHPQPESYWGNVNPIGLRSCYDEGKRCAETICMDFSRQYGTEIKIVRIFNTYGPRMAVDDGRVVSNFIVQALRGEDLTIYGTGQQTRSFQFVSDLVTGVIALMESERGFYGPVNIGNPKEFTILELADKVIKLTGSRSKIKFQKLPSDDPRQRQPVIALAEDKLKWSPKVSLDEGLRMTIEYFSRALNLRP